MVTKKRRNKMTILTLIIGITIFGIMIIPRKKEEKHAILMQGPS